MACMLPLVAAGSFLDRSTKMASVVTSESMNPMEEVSAHVASNWMLLPPN